MKQRNKLGVFTATSVKINSTFDHGYITGFILGDGCATKGSYLVHGKRTPCYKILVGTTVRATAEHFRDKMSISFPQLSPYFRETTHKYKTQRVPYFEVWIQSKELWAFIRPLKLPDFIWRFPGELGSIEFKRGFLQGICDAEGCISQNHGHKGFPSYNTLYWRIDISQKQKGNLDQIAMLLQEFNVSGKIYRNGGNMWKLSINKRDQVLQFCREISFSLPYKKAKADIVVQELSQPQVPRWEKIPLARRKEIIQLASDGRRKKREARLMEQGRFE